MSNLRETAISGGEIIAMLKKLKGSPVLFLDACHSAASAAQSTSQFAPFNTAKVANGFTGVVPRAVIFASSDGNESSREDQDWNNGAFTKAVLEALGAQQGQKAGADYHHDGKITVAELDSYIEDAVPRLTKDQQHPKMQNMMGSIKFLAEAR
jgi:hypothetical protein